MPPQRPFLQPPFSGKPCAKHSEAIAEMDKVTSLLKLEITNIKEGQSEMKNDVKEMKVTLKDIGDNILTLNTDKKWAGLLAAGIAGAAGSLVAIVIQVMFSAYMKK